MESEIQIELLPAQHGDCVLVRCLAGERATNILVDGGPRETYEATLRPRLLELAALGERLDLVVVSHADSDHIEGVIALMEENGDAASPKVIPIADCWHNSYRHLELQGRAPTAAEVERVQRQVVDPGLRNLVGPISGKQGTTLAGLLRRGGYSWNGAFGQAAAIAPSAVRVGLDVDIQVVSPGREQLRRLGKLWRRELLAFGVAPDAVSPAEFEEAFERQLRRSAHAEDDSYLASSSTSLAAPPPDAFIEDLSATNASSIALIVEFHRHKVLLLGDAVPSVVVEGLKASGKTDPIDVDWVKVSHHGSRRNTSRELCQSFRARGFLVSTDGTRHRHPDSDALLTILASQARGVTMIFNYKTQAADFIGSSDAVARYGHRTRFVPNGRPIGHADLEVT